MIVYFNETEEKKIGPWRVSNVYVDGDHVRITAYPATTMLIRDSDGDLISKIDSNLRNFTWEL